MPLEHRHGDMLLPVALRRQDGKALRKAMPRGQHALWEPPANRRDPVATIIETGRHGIGSLLPLRYERMSASPFAFFRGAAAIMAADLGALPSTDIWVQSCGDCHLGNFGVFASPEGNPVFDINDFDDTLPAPFEWDVKRLAASFAVYALAQKMDAGSARGVARTAVMSYRLHMLGLARMDPLLAWRSRIDVVDLLNGIADTRTRSRELRRLREATEASRDGYPKLIERGRSGWRIKEKPQELVPLSGQSDDTLERVASLAFTAWRAALPEERRLLIDHYDLHDVAFKVVGIGSVGRFCAIGLFATPDNHTLLLQVKEAQDSVLAPFAGPSAYASQGQRVVVGQRIMQAQADPFLGWTDHPLDDQHCYVRQLKDSRLALVGTDLTGAALADYATVCGLALARAHARSGDAARIAGYLGAGSAFDAAVASFAMAYAAQMDRDWQLFLAAIKCGMIHAVSA